MGTEHAALEVGGGQRVNRTDGGMRARHIPVARPCALGGLWPGQNRFWKTKRRSYFKTPPPGAGVVEGSSICSARGVDAVCVFARNVKLATPLQFHRKRRC